MTVLFSPISISIKLSSILASFLAALVIILRGLEVKPNYLTEALEWLGDRSYSIYLLHLPLLWLAKYSRATQIGDGNSRSIQIVIAVIVSVVLGSVSYSKIENRFRGRASDRIRFLKIPSLLVALTSLLSLALFVALDSGAKNNYWGLEQRFPLPAYAGAWDPNCVQNSGKGLPCIYHHPGATKTALLIGDSHAEHISQAFVEATKLQNWNAIVWVYGSCHIQFVRSRKSELTDNCLQMNLKMKEWVLLNKPETIIVSQYTRFNSTQSDLRDALLDLKKIVPSTMLIENTPVFPDGEDFMVRRPLVMSVYSPPKNFPKHVMDLTDELASNQLAEWARSRNINTLNLNSLFCSSSFCVRYSDVGWLFGDSHHFSSAGVKLVVPALDSFLKKINSDGKD